jgi:hypothetical protein
MEAGEAWLFSALWIRRLVCNEETYTLTKISSYIRDSANHMSLAAQLEFCQINFALHLRRQAHSLNIHPLSLRRWQHD